ncbi:uncharacterized protein LOC124181990 [Neodiprion fabricii]|uniref:uncharacterized protein LOC124181990 n=1 Tax=Neodiprion fabricii TaxID=2872261 RepID=UPI001ED924FE|nr:uncharacterized protein LOC124181990 [Neodiprion fabricii]
MPMLEQKQQEGGALESGNAKEAGNSYVNDETDYSMWKQLILIHTKSAWNNLIALMVFIEFQLVLYDVSFRGRTSFPPQTSVIRRSVGQRTVSIRIIELLVLLFSMTGVAIAVMIRTVDMIKLDLKWLAIIEERSTNPKSEFEWCVICYYVIMTQVSGHGFPEVYPANYSFVFIVIVLAALWMVQAFEIAHMTDILVQRDYNRSLFHREMHLITSYMDEITAPKEMRYKVEKYFTYFWKKQGNSEFNIMKFTLYPTIFLKECALELAWDAYKHSHLFRDQPIPFLRNLAILFEHEYYRPGEVIFRKYEWKTKLIYVVKGVIQLLSEEDDQSPILSFSGGTVLGESTLILSHRSLCNVIACTEVELNVLHRHKFVELMSSRYHGIHRVIQSRVRLRYWKAVRMVAIGAALQKNKSHIVNVPACTDIAWLKQTLTVLQNRTNRITRREKRGVQTDTVFTSTDFRYTFAFLDMLVISDDIATMTEQVCLNNGKLPWIFCPDTMILKYWRAFVMACCLVLTAIIPLHVTLPSFQVIDLIFGLHVLSLVYLFDFLIISSTVIHENDMVYTDILDIISRRMHYMSYWADFMAAFPADWILEMFGSRDAQVLAYCKLNRLVKIYKFSELFSFLENKMILSSKKILMIKYAFYMMTLIYLSGAYILLATCPYSQCDSSGWLQIFLATSNEDMTGRFLASSLFYASQILIGVGIDLIVPVLVTEYLVSISLIVIGATVFVYFISSATACQILDGFTKTWLRFNTANIALMMDINMVTKSIQNRVFCYLEMEWFANKAHVLTFERQIFDTMTAKLRQELDIERFASLIRKVEFFGGMSEECINEICSVCRLMLLPPHEVLGYRGSECQEMYIIEKGHCQIWRNVDWTPIDLTKGTELYVLEMCCSMNKVHTVTTVTHASVVQIRLRDLMQVLSKFLLEKRCLTRVLAKFRNSAEFTKLVSIQSNRMMPNEMAEIEKKWQEIEDLTRRQKSPKIQSLEKDTLSDHAIGNVSGERSWRHTLMMLFLFKSTINPDGRFIKIWEGVRFTCAYLLITLYSGDAIFSQLMPDFFRITAISTLNLMMVIDFYVQLHVQFYNNHRILVTHPLSTAKNYVFSGMIVDLIAVFPFEYFFLSPASRNAKTLWFYRLNRILMTHRMIADLMHYYSWPYTLKYMSCVIFLPLITLIGHVFACALLHELCDLGSDVKKNEDFAPGISCSLENVQMKHEERDPITPLKMYIYSLLYVCATLTRIGDVNLKPMRYSSVVYILVMTSMSFLLLMIVVTHTISTISQKDAKLTAYQQQMMILMSYLKENKVSTELRHEVVNYFENFWILRRGTSIIKQMQLFPPALKDDVLWCVYGPSLMKSPGFSQKNESFFRSLFRNMEVKFYSKRSEIMTVNLVHRSVYFIHRGLAEAFGPDGTLIAVLGCGSIFGNFTGSSTMRQTCSIVTRTHVEAIVIDSTDFFNLMMSHPGMKKRFLSAVALNTDFLETECEAETTKDTGDQFRTKSSVFILLPNSKLVRAWEIFAVLFSCHFAFSVCLYHIAVNHFKSRYSLIILYVTDLIFLVKIVLVFFTAFEDDLGDFVVDKAEIARSLLHAATCFLIIAQKAAFDDMTALEGLEIYVNNFYAVSATFAVISSRIIAKNSLEACYFIVLFLIFYVAYSVLLGEICAIVGINQFIMNEYERRINFFRDRMNCMDLTYALKLSAWNYGSKLWDMRSGQQTPVLMSELPVYLQYAVSYQMYGRHLRRSSVFGELHEDFIKQLTFHFKDSLFFPGDTIVHVGEVDETIYFVHKGTVNVTVQESLVDEEDTRLTKTLRAGDSFGILQGLYEKMPHNATYTAQTTTHIVYLNRPDWIYLLKYFPVTAVKLYREATRLIQSSGLEVFV